MGKAYGACCCCSRMQHSSVSSAVPGGLYRPSSSITHLGGCAPGWPRGGGEVNPLEETAGVRGWGYRTGETAFFSAESGAEQKFGFG